MVATHAWGTASHGPKITTPLLQMTPTVVIAKRPQSVEGLSLKFGRGLTVPKLVLAMPGLQGRLCRELSRTQSRTVENREPPGRIRSHLHESQFQKVVEGPIKVR